MRFVLLPCTILHTLSDSTARIDRDCSKIPSKPNDSDGSRHRCVYAPAPHHIATLIPRGCQLQLAAARASSQAQNSHRTPHGFVSWFSWRSKAFRTPEGASSQPIRGGSAFVKVPLSGSLILNDGVETCKITEAWALARHCLLHCRRYGQQPSAFAALPRSYILTADRTEGV